MAFISDINGRHMECHPHWLWGAHAEMFVGGCLTALSCLSHFTGTPCAVPPLCGMAQGSAISGELQALTE